ncbi:MAG: BNR-4 repeat-containing protein [Cyclobacteriaceae bacterium]
MKLALITPVLYCLSFLALGQSATLEKILVANNVWATNPVIATSTQQNGLAVYKNFVYMTYYNSDRNLCIARNSNNGEGDDWVIVVLPHIYEMRNNTWDNHNTPNIIVSPNDQRIHLSFDMHARNLRYIISTENAATVSDDQFTAGLFSDTRDYLEASQIGIARVTYPRFFIGSNDQLFFLYRTGGSGNGDTYFTKYKDDGFWTKPVEIIDGNTGSFEGSNDRCAYFNNVHYKDGRIYLTWVWRETPDAGTNHDLMFAFSDDDGNSWKNSLGVKIAGRMTLNSQGLKVANIPTGSGLSNHNGCSVDGYGNVHVVLRVGGEYQHHFGIRNGNKFTWSKQVITSMNADRPKFYSDQRTNDLYFLVRQGNGLKLWATKENGSKWNQWSEVSSNSDSYMTSTNSVMNEDGSQLTSMVVSTNNRLQLLRWSLTTDSPEIEKKIILKAELPEDFSIFPNPSQDGIFALSKKIPYQVFDLSGTLITQGIGDTVNISSFPKGIYLLDANDQRIKLIRL